MKPHHGTGVWYWSIIMSVVELQARIKEQELFKRQQKLKYRGVEYTKTTYKT